MTEEEAETKWCPFTRIVGTNGTNVPPDQAAFNRVTEIRGPAKWPDAALCIGSACMAWRWNGHRTDYDEDVNATYPKIGYCGLAGKP